MIFKKYRVTNVREVAQLTEILKHKFQAKAQRIRRYKKRETQYIQNKCSKKTPKDLQKVGHKEYRCQRCQRNERAEWIRRKERRKICNMD